MREVVFVEGMRTPIGKMGGTIKTFSSAELAARYLLAALDGREEP